MKICFSAFNREFEIKISQLAEGELETEERGAFDHQLSKAAQEAWNRVEAFHRAGASN